MRLVESGAVATAEAGGLEVFTSGLGFGATSCFAKGTCPLSADISLFLIINSPKNDKTIAVIKKNRLKFRKPVFRSKTASAPDDATIKSVL